MVMWIQSNVGIGRYPKEGRYINPSCATADLAFGVHCELRRVDGLETPGTT